MSKSTKRPYWQHADCPPWCISRHRKYEGGSDRDHFSRWYKRVVMTLMEPCRTKIDGEVFYDKPSVEIYLQQSYREVAPRVQVDAQTDDGIHYLEFTVDEALRFAKALTTAVEVAGGAS